MSVMQYLFECLRLLIFVLELQLTNELADHAVGSHANGCQPPRDVNSVKAQINGILHEDSLPYYDQVSGPAAPSRQSSVPLPRTTGHSHTAQSHSASPRGRLSQPTPPTRLQTQGSSMDLGDLGVSSPTGMSRANSRDSGHISTQAPAQYASASWQGRLSRASAEQHHQQPSARQQPARQTGAAHHGSAQQGSAFSLEAMLSSIPESLSSMPSVPSMSDIERSMQSGWSSFTGSLGLSSTPQQEAAAPVSWTAFADEPASVPTSQAPTAPAAAGSSRLQQADALSSAGPGSDSLQTSIGAIGPGGQSPPANQAPPLSPRRKLTGLQSLDPLTAAKEAASVPLRAMASFRQDSPKAGSKQSLESGAQPLYSGISRASDAVSATDNPFVSTVAASPSNDWSDFAAVGPVGLSSAQESPRRDAQTLHASVSQGTSSAAGTDLWAQWSVPSPAQDKPPSTSSDNSAPDAPVAPFSTKPLTGRLSLLDM